MSRKNKSNNNADNMPKKWVLAIIGCVVIFVLASIVTVFVIENKRNATFDIGFYQIPENISSFMEKKITQKYTGKMTFKNFDDTEILDKKLVTKYDIIFCPNGSFVNSIAKHTKRNAVAVYSNMPRAITDKTQVTVPFLLDHYEFAYFRPTKSSAIPNLPQSLMELQDYLENSKKQVFSPFFCAGGDDKTLLALVSAFIESYGGSDAYYDFIEAAKKDSSLSSLSKKKLAFASEKSKTFTITDILDIFRNWKENEMVHPDWYNANFNDVKTFMEDKQIGVVFMPLSFHRTISYKVIRDFEADRIPVRSAKDNHGLIAPEYVGIKFSNDPLCDQIFADIVEEESQAEFSDQSKLAPVNSRCGAFDRQSDDVRFFAAACKDGPIPPLYQAVFQTDEKALHEFAEQIRVYLRVGKIE